MIVRTYPVVGWLSLAQALYWSCSIIGIALTGLVGQQLAPQAWLATLPLTLLVIGNLASIQPLARWIARHGTRQALGRGAWMGVASGLLAVAAMYIQSFVLFGVSMALLGGYQASCGFYRFVALQGVSTAHHGRVAAWVVGGGVLAAVAAPSLALWSQSRLGVPYAGAYLCMAALAGLGAVVLHRLPSESALPVAATDVPVHGMALRRQLLQRPLLRQALLLTAGGHGLMVLVMNATPLAMHQMGMSLAHSTHVIQWHVLGMFLPSFFAGAAIDRWGSRRVAALALVLLMGSALVALSGEAVVFFWASSLLLGAGWNLLLLAGTTQLVQAHSAQERVVAQPLMEWANGASAAAMSLVCGALVHTMGWQAINAAMLLVLAAMAGVLVLYRGRPSPSETV